MTLDRAFAIVKESQLLLIAEYDGGERRIAVQTGETFDLMLKGANANRPVGKLDAGILRSTASTIPQGAPWWAFWRPKRRIALVLAGCVFTELYIEVASKRTQIRLTVRREDNRIGTLYVNGRLVEGDLDNVWVKTAKKR